MRHGDAYFDIVWRQFRKNYFALAALWLLVPIVLAAIFAPLIASDRPLVFQEWEPQEAAPATAAAEAGAEAAAGIEEQGSAPDEAPPAGGPEADADGNGRAAAGDGEWVVRYPWLPALFSPPETVDLIFNMALLAFFPVLIAGAVFNHLARKRGMSGWRRLAIVLTAYVVVSTVLSVVFYFEATRPDDPYRGRSFAEEEFLSPETKIGWYTPIPFGPTQPDPGAFFESPGFRKLRHEWSRVSDFFPRLLGTDNLGRDVLVRILYGTRIAITIGFVAVGLYVTIGVVMGAVAGYFGGRVDMFLSRVFEVVLLFPSFFLILTLVGLLGPSIYIIMVVIGVTGWPTIARLIRGEFLKQRSQDYVAAARALGASNGRIIFRHILPNALTPALVATPFGIAGAIITEAGLSLLGFGVRPPAPSWGAILQLGSQNYTYWWLVVFPAVAIFFTVTLFNLIGSGLRDAMDPRLRR